MMMTFSIGRRLYLLALARTSPGAQPDTGSHPCYGVWEMPRKKRAERQGQERREQERRDVELNVNLGAYGKYYLSKLKNISTGGAFLLTRNLETVGTDVKVRFKLPEEEASIEASGKVVWTYLQEGTREPNSS